MSEKIEQRASSQNERSHEALEKQAAERKEQLREQVERKAEASRERTGEQNTAEKEKAAKELAKTAEKEQHNAEKQVAPAQKRREKLVRNKKTLDASFDREMKVIRSQMPPASRAFSKVIHNKVIERASEVAGNTIARPNAILAGSTFALIFTAVIYFWAKNAGYPLSGFETIAAFFVGWLCGIIFDFVRIALTGKN